MEKEKFGEFVAQKRKEKEMTQKELADRLLVSDKAVSKWERGLSYPDITLLEPLSKILSVSITELMEGKEMEKEEIIDRAHVDEMLRETIEINSRDEKKEKREKIDRITIALLMLVAAGFESLVLCFMAKDVEMLSMYYWTVEGLSLFFGIYFWIFIKEKLPTYYDENKIDYYTDGFMRMDVPGVHFNNTNWPFIVRGLRYWALIVTVCFPVLTFFVDKFINVGLVGALTLSFVTIFSLFFVVWRESKRE